MAYAVAPISSQFKVTVYPNRALKFQHKHQNGLVTSALLWIYFER